MPEVMWSTLLGFALPLIGADTSVLTSAGYQRVPQTCGNISEWDREHTAAYAFGFSNAVYGEIIVVANTEDEMVQQLVLMAGQLPFESDPLSSRADFCSDPPPPVRLHENQLGVVVETRACANGAGIVETALSATDYHPCSLLEAFSGPPNVSLWLPRRY